MTETADLPASSPGPVGGALPTGEIGPVAVAPASPTRLSRGAWGWALYQGARDPYIILIVIYVFAPYFATTVVGDPVRGQKLVAVIGLIGGLLTAFTAPLLGSSIDGLGRRKPGLLLCTWLMVPAIAALWWVRPGAPGAVMMGAALLIFTNLMFAWSEVFHNSLLTRAASRSQAPHASGLALAAANGVSVVMLVFVLWAFALPAAHVPWPFIPARPLFGLSSAAHETDRITAPLCALVLVLGSIPLFLFTRDAEPTGLGLAGGVRRGASQLVFTVRSLGRHRDTARFLGARMLYTDGMTALLGFAGVYAAGVMHWGVLELLAYGIALSAFAVIGGFAGGQLDQRLGPTVAVRIELAVAILLQLATLGMRRDRILFFWAYDPAAHAPLWHGPVFRTLPEMIYLMIGFGIAVVVSASYASSRTLLTRLAPEGQTASFFGLYALSGTATVWLGSLLVGLSTAVFKTQQAGFAPIAGLLTLGLIGMFFVRGGRREA